MQTVYVILKKQYDNIYYAMLNEEDAERYIKEHPEFYYQPVCGIDNYDQIIKVDQFVALCKLTEKERQLLGLSDLWNKLKKRKSDE